MFTTVHPTWGKEETLPKEKIPTHPRKYFTLSTNTVPGRSPFHDFFTLNDWSQSFVSGSNFILEKLFDIGHINSYWPVRLTEFYLSTSVHTLIQFFFHESAHQAMSHYNILNNIRASIGIQSQPCPPIPYFSVLGSKWLNQYISKQKTQDMLLDALIPRNKKIKQKDIVGIASINSTIVGLQQNAYFAQRIYERSARFTKINWFDSYALVANLLYPFQYDLQSLYIYDASIGDPNAFRKKIKEFFNIKISKGQMMASRVIATLLNTSLIEHFWLTYKFLAYNQREHKSWLIQNWGVPPLIQYMYTTFGDFFTVTFPIIKPKPIVFYPEIGFGFSKPGLFRVALKAILPISENITWTPFIAYNYIGYNKKHGYNLGFDIETKIYNSGKLFLSFLHSYMDILDTVRLGSQYNSLWLQPYTSINLRIGIHFTLT